VRDFLRRVLSETRNALLAGVLVVAPLGISLWVLSFLVGFADKAIHILPDRWQPEVLLGFPIPGLGILITGIFLILVGLGMRYYTGRRVVSFYESLLGRVPLLSGVYQGVKQLVQTLFDKSSQPFRQVILIEYPRHGLWCLGFLTTQDAYVCIEATADHDTPTRPSDLVSVFVPTTPNPTSGFYLLVPREDVLLVDLTVEEAFKLIMSAGVVGPHRFVGTRRLDAPALTPPV
jgi:uncharacterized membrane protein